MSRGRWVTDPPRQEHHWSRCYHCWQGLGHQPKDPHALRNHNIYTAGPQSPGMRPEGLVCGGQGGSQEAQRHNSGARQRRAGCCHWGHVPDHATGRIPGCLPPRPAAYNAASEVSWRQTGAAVCIWLGFVPSARGERCCGVSAPGDTWSRMPQLSLPTSLRQVQVASSESQASPCTCTSLQLQFPTQGPNLIPLQMAPQPASCIPYQLLPKSFPGHPLSSNQEHSLGWVCRTPEAWPGFTSHATF